MTTPQSFHEDAFFEIFKPYRPAHAAHDIWGGIGLDTFGSDLELVRSLDPRHVWTVVESDEGQWITPGIHSVNLICFLVTAKAHDWIDVQFNASPRTPWLTPLGLKKQVTQIQRMMR